MDADFAAVARLLANPARSAMVSALLEGRAMTATELARRARVARSTASEHLAELTRGGLAESLAQGRHRYYRIGDPAIAEALESFALICPPLPVRSLRAAHDHAAVAVARLCYDHLAGDLGVRLHDALVANQWLIPAQPDYELTDRGAAALAAIAIPVDQARRSGRRFAYPCLDWTARRFHLAGALGAAIAGTVMARGWVIRTSTRRGLQVPPECRDDLQNALQIAI